MNKNEISDIGKIILKKLKAVNHQNLDISEYNQTYLNKYIKNFDFYNDLYAQLFQKIIHKLDKPINESVFLDYGGGIGLLSYYAIEIGFKEVIYNDIYDVSVQDVKRLSNKLNLLIKSFILGDIPQVTHFLKSNNLKPNAICSFDVIEHIYNLKDWFSELSTLNHSYILVFMTSANSKNPFISNRLKKLQLKAEYNGFKKTKGWKQIDNTEAYLKVRRKIISNYNANLKPKEIDLIAKNTRGLRIDDIKKTVDYYFINKKFNYSINHPTNTCDPYTGNWNERLINLQQLKSLASTISSDIEFTNTLYSHSKNKIFFLPKYFLNILIKLFGKNHLIFSHTYSLELKKLI